jgi:hypothetical protein
MNDEANMFEILGYGGAVDYLLQPRGYHIMLHKHAAFARIAVDPAEPILHARIQPDIPAVSVQILFPERNAAGARFRQHEVHIGRNGVGVLGLGHLDRARPEIVRLYPEPGHEPVLLHVARGQSPVEVIAHGHGNKFFHSPYSL